MIPTPLLVLIFLLFLFLAFDLGDFFLFHGDIFGPRRLSTVLTSRSIFFAKMSSKIVPAEFSRWRGEEIVGEAQVRIYS